MLQKVITYDLNSGKSEEITQDVNIGLSFLNNVLRPAYQRMRQKGTNHTAVFFGGYAFEIWEEILTPPGDKRVRRWKIHYGFGMDDEKRLQVQNKTLAAFRCWGVTKMEASWVNDRNGRTLFQIDEVDPLGLV